ncbi:hypothetical protein KAR91_67345 [Candidatus Pacearchaeota archaeon]|nr:hypothetical protein [Candidatus Pacearchaeota archaeon]
MQNFNPMNLIDSLNPSLGSQIQETVMKSNMLAILVAVMAAFTLNACGFENDQPSGNDLSSMTITNSQSAFEATCSNEDNGEAPVLNVTSSEADGVHSVNFENVLAMPYSCEFDPTDVLFETLYRDIDLGFEHRELEIEFNAVGGGTVDPPLEIDLTVDNSEELALEAKITELNQLAQLEVDAFECDYVYNETGINDLRVDLIPLEYSANNAGVSCEERANEAVRKAYEGCGANGDELCTDTSEEIIALRQAADDHVEAVRASAAAEVNAATKLSWMANEQIICDSPVVSDPSTITPELLDVGGWVENQLETVHISVARDGAFVGTLCEIAAGDSRVCNPVEVDPDLSYNLYVHFGPADPASWDVLFSVEVFSLLGADLPVQLPVYEPAPQP